MADDGRGTSSLPHAARGGGFGLIGLTERVTALDAELHTGPRPGHHGWQLTTRIPTTSS